MKRIPAIIAAAGVAALAVTGTAYAATRGAGGEARPLTGLGAALTAEPTPTTDDTPLPTDAATPTDPATSTTPPMSADRLTAEKAAEIALARTGGGTVTEIESEFEHGFSTWKIEIVKSGVEHDIYVDRATGRIVKSDTDTRDDDARDDRHDDDAGDDRRDDDARDDRHDDDARDDDGRRGDDDDDDDDDRRGRGGSDDPATHDADDDKGGNRGGHGSDDD